VDRPGSAPLHPLPSEPPQRQPPIGRRQSPSRLLALPPPADQRRQVFLSYWEDERPAGKVRAQVADALYQALAKDAGLLPVRDREQIKTGDRISVFMDRLARADLVVAIVSDKYLRSPYCMYEIYRIWQKWQGDLDDLSRHVVPILLPEVKVDEFSDRVPYLEYWTEQAESLEALIRDRRLRPSAESWRQFRLVQEFAHHVDDILWFLRDILMPRQLDAHLDQGFPAVLEALRWRIAAVDPG
jgi:internalin A